MGTTTMKDLYLPEAATAVAIRDLTQTEKLFTFKFDSGRELGHKPGQFAEISIPGIGEAPISISSAPGHNGGTFEMGIRRVGNLTTRLHALTEGAKVGIRGPFGTSFPVDGEMLGKDIVFVCGGIGLIPLRSAITYVLANRSKYGNVTVLSGTKTPADRLFTDELAQWEKRKDVELLETVDTADASWKKRTGVVTTLFQNITIDPANTVAVICGPPVMYKFVLLELRKYDLSGDNVYVSLERHMKCGIGKCGHCQINGLYACQDGPVFRYSEIENVREAI
ncbi:MAG TPA: oxidoreductase [Spirochaetia bacterium]|nr:oxidoreductase [Spirochaetia bacterium]